VVSVAAKAGHFCTAPCGGVLQGGERLRQGVCGIRAYGVTGKPVVGGKPPGFLCGFHEPYCVIYSVARVFLAE